MSKLEFVFKSIAASCMSFIMIFYACKHFTIVVKEQYWNSTSENECMVKVKCIISHIDKDFVFFSPTNLSYKLNYIYRNMSYSEKKNLGKRSFKVGCDRGLNLLLMTINRSCVIFRFNKINISFSRVEIQTKHQFCRVDCVYIFYDNRIGYIQIFFF